jgi:putative hydrolase of the HAD superfamily
MIIGPPLKNGGHCFFMKPAGIKALIFDWGDTVMRDYPDLPGPMYTWPHVEAIHGIQEVLETVFHSYNCIIATNAGCSDTEAMRKALRRIEFEKYFNYFFSSKDLGYEKPDPRFFDEICCQTGFKPLECMMIGNSYEKDITGAKKAGMLTVFFNENNLVINTEYADFVINNMQQLKEIIC